MIRDGVFWQGGGWGSRTEFSAPEEFNMQTVLFHVSGCEPRIPEVGDLFFSWFYKKGAPDRLGRFEFVEVHRPQDNDPDDAFFGTVKLSHVGEKTLPPGTISWTIIDEPSNDVNAIFMERG
jgi:hypothetical protein